jgi:hypothetical protein
MKFNSRVLNAAVSKNQAHGESKNHSFVTSNEDSSRATFTASRDVIPTKKDLFNNFICEFPSDDGFSNFDIEPLDIYAEKQRRRCDYDRKTSNSRHYKNQSRLHEQIENLAKCYSLQPEGGIELQSDFLISVFGTRNIVFFASFLTGLKTSTSWVNTISIVTMYLSQVLTPELTETILDEFFNHLSPEEGEDEKSLWEKAKSVTGIFSKFRNTVLYKKLRDVITICVVSGLIGKDSGNITAQALKIFSVKASSTMDNIADIWELISKTVIYFAETGYRIFTGGATDLFEPVDIMSSYQKVLEYWPICKNGNLMRTHNMDARDFGHLLDKTSKMLASACNETKGPEKALYMRMVTNIGSIRAEYLQFKTDGKLRQAPIMVAIQGDSGVAKSTITQMFAVTVLKAMNRPSTADRIRTYTPTDRYDSWADGMVEALICDDIGALDIEYSTANPAEFLIKIKNNAPMTAVKAAVDEKGMIPIDVSLVICTMNSFKSLTEGATCKEAVLRRFDVVFRPYVRPEFRTSFVTNTYDPVKAIDAYKGTDQLMQCWDFQIVEPKLIPIATVDGDRHDYNAEIHSFDEKSLERTSTKVEWTLINVVDTVGALNYLVKKAKLHKFVQTQVVETNEQFNNMINICNVCNGIVGYCSCCKAENVTPELGSQFLWSSIVSFYDGNKFANAVNSIPERFIRGKYSGMLADFVFRQRLLNYFRNQSKYILLAWIHIIFFTLGLFIKFPNAFVAFCICIIYYQSFIFTVGFVRKCREHVYDEILADYGGYDVRNMFKVIQNYRVKAAGTICVAAVALFKFYTYYKNMSISVESALDPDNKAEADERLSQINPWAELSTEPLPVSTVSKSSCIERSLNAISNNLVYASWIENGVRKFSNAFFVKSNFAIFPYHMIPKYRSQRDGLIVEFKRKEDGVVNSGFYSPCAFHTAERIPETDLVIVQVQNAPSFADVTDWFLIEPTARQSGLVKEICRLRDGSLVYDNYRVSASMVSNNAEGSGLPRFLGSMHNTKELTFDGRCMAIQLLDTKNPYIFGFHLGGNKKYLAVSGCLSKKQIDLAIMTMTNVLPEASNSDFPQQMCGTQVVTSSDVHPKCPTRFLKPEDLNSVHVYGTAPGRATYRSSVVDTVISESVNKRCGIPQKWGPPKMNATKAHRDALIIAANASSGFDPEALDWAIEDYTSSIITKLKLIDADIRPLSHIESVNGIPGKRFVDRMVRSTSIGFPRTGKKSKYFTPLEPTEEYPDAVDMDEESMKEVERMISCYKDGKRAHVCARTALKDEPTKLTKDKTRIFYVLNASTQYLIRKYFLTICAGISTIPLESGCAVGINCQGPEWDELISHVSQYGSSNIFAGDYSKFDLRLPSQVIRASFKCFIKIAEAFGYSNEDIMIMKGLCADISNPTISWNGTLLMLNALHLSGSSLTVYVGTISSQLMLRMHWFDQWHHTPYITGIPYTVVPAFRDFVSAVGYGDDLFGGVSSDVADIFNHITYARFMEKHGMMFTMPDKESLPVPLMNINDVDFLKRKSRFAPELGVRVGVLDEMSIFKSLHSVLLSKELTPDEAAAINIDGAIREFYFHGKEVFERRIDELRLVASDCNLTDRCVNLNTTFDYWTAKWNQRYRNGPQVDDRDVFKPDEIVFIAPECGQEAVYDTVEHYSFCNNSNSYFWWEPCLLILNMFSVLFAMMWLIYADKYYLPRWDKRWLYIIAYSSLLGEGTLFRALVSWVSLPMLLNIGIFFRSATEFLLSLRDD